MLEPTRAVHGVHPTAQSARTRRPRVLILADRRGWAYDGVAHALQAHLAPDFDIEIAYVVERPILDPSKYDLLHVCFWGETWHRNFWTDPRRVLKEVSSHRWALEESWGQINAAQLCERFLSDAATIVSTSPKLAAEVGAVRPVHRVSNGFDPDRYVRRDARYGPITFGWAGNASDPCKGVRDVVIPACGADFELSIAGGDLTPAQMAEFYSTIDVLLIASTAEGTPLPLLEAMASGCYVIATDVGVVSEVIRHGENGRIVERSIPEFRAAMQWCMLNADRVRSAGQRNAREITETRSWATVAPQWGEAYRQALAAVGETVEHRDIATSADADQPLSQEHMNLPHMPTQPDAANGDATIAALKQGYSTHFAAMNTGTTDDATYRASSFYYQLELAPLLPPDRASRIVDVGSGYGHLVRWSLEQGYADTGGVELDATLHAKSKAALGNRPTFLEHGDALDFLARHKGSFDAVVSFDVIEHFPLEGALAFARALRGALRPGGKVILRTPNMANFFGVFSRYIDLTHQIGFTEFSLTHLLREAGFSDVGVHAPAWPSDHPLGAKLLESRRIHDQLFSLQDRSTPKSFDKNLVMWARTDA